MGSLEAASFLPILLTLTLIISPISFLSSHNNNFVVSANELLIQTECHLTTFPDICIQCVKSDPGSALADKKGIATILVNCLSTHATTLENSALQIASSVIDPIMKTAFQSCVTQYGFAKQVLDDAKRVLMVPDAAQGVSYVAQARTANANCQTTIALYVGIISKLFPFEQATFEELSNVANSIILAGI